jgi:hypothetical protein
MSTSSLSLISFDQNGLVESGSAGIDGQPGITKLPQTAQSDWWYVMAFTCPASRHLVVDGLGRSIVAFPSYAWDAPGHLGIKGLEGLVVSRSLPGGAPDPSLNGTGFVNLTHTDGPTSAGEIAFIRDLAIDSDHRILLADSRVLLRLTESGEVDTGFGQDPSRPGRYVCGKSHQIEAVEVCDNGDVLVLESRSHDRSDFGEDGPTWPYRITRLDGSGSRRPSSEWADDGGAGFWDDRVSPSLIFRDVYEIVNAGSVFTLGTSFYRHPQEQRMFIHRFLHTGVGNTAWLDRSRAVEAEQVAGPPNPIDLAVGQETARPNVWRRVPSRICVDSVGRILISGSLALDDPTPGLTSMTPSFIIRLDSGGNRDQSFGTDGMVLIDTERGIDIDLVEDDIVVLAQFTLHTVSVFKLSAATGELVDGWGTINKGWVLPGDSVPTDWPKPANLNLVRAARALYPQVVQQLGTDENDDTKANRGIVAFPDLAQLFSVSPGLVFRSLQFTNVRVSPEGEVSVLAHADLGPYSPD